MSLDLNCFAAFRIASQPDVRSLSPLLSFRRRRTVRELLLSLVGRRRSFGSGLRQLAVDGHGLNNENQTGWEELVRPSD